MVAAFHQLLTFAKIKKCKLLFISARGSDDTNLTKELQSIQKKYNLSISKIAKITGRKKLKTCEGG